MIEEKWKHIEGFEGLYKISNKGEVLSLTLSNGKIIKRRCPVPKKPILRKIRGESYEYRNRLYVYLYNGFGRRKIKSIGKMIMNAFGEKKPYKGAVIHYRDKNIYNNSVENLYWGKQPPWETLSGN